MLPDRAAWEGRGLILSQLPEMQMEGHLSCMPEQQRAPMVRSHTPVTDELLAAATRLQVVGPGQHRPRGSNPAVGLGVHAPRGEVSAAAELIMALFLALARPIPTACSAQQGRLVGQELLSGRRGARQVLAIVGLGTGGKEMTQRVKD